MQYLLKYYGQGVLALIAIVPVVLWLADTGFSTIFASPGVLVASGGKAAALSGIALYSIMPLLSMRHRIVNGLFGGIDKAYSLHGSGGKVSFYLILLHPLLLGLGRWIGGTSIGVIWDWSSLLVLSGIMAFIVLIFVTFVSIYAHIKHQNWVWVHRLFGWLVPVFLAHALLARGQIVQNTQLFVYILGVALIGFSAFMYRSVFSKYLIKRYRYIVSEVNQFTDKIVEVVLQPTGVPIAFNPGQFAYVAFESSVIDGEAHPFSFSNSNNGPYVRFTIKTLGDDTAKIQHIEQGAKALLEGPYGRFSYKNIKNSKQVWIAGGIGITPFLSMARSFSGKKKYDIHFFYGTESLDEAVFLQEFIDITRIMPENFRTSVVSKETSGFVTIDLLKKSLSTLREYDYMICGPPGMMKALSMQLKEAGVADDQIHIEAFSM